MIFLKNIFNAPKVFYVILSIELCERLAFYGLQSIAVIYFIQKLGISESSSSNLFASFSALAYAMLIIGGMLGDRVLGMRRTYLLGIIFLMSGYGIIGITTNISMIYLGMGSIVVGNVLFKPNSNNYVGNCFGANDKRIDSAFTYFYMVTNIGIFLGTIIVPFIAKMFTYKLGFAVCALSMVVALLLSLIFSNSFIKSDNYMGQSFKKPYILYLVGIGGVISVVLVSLLLSQPYISSILFYLIAIITILVYIFIAVRLGSNEARGMYIALILWLASIAFFILYMQIATSITLFALHNVNLTIGNYTAPAGMTQSLPPFFIIIISPILSSLYMFLHKNNINYNIAAKFATGMFLVGICFVVLGIGGNYFADSFAQVSVQWLIIGYALYAAGELLVSALGASMIVQLLPKSIYGFGQGMWYLGAAIGMKLGGELSTTVLNSSNIQDSASHSLTSYVNLFYKMGIYTVIISIIFFILIKPLSKSMTIFILNKK